MKNYIIFSDIHGNRGSFEKLLPLINENDGAFFAGDGSQTFSPGEIKGEFYAVKGNNDYAVYPSERVIEIEETRIFLTHGDLYGVRQGLTRLKLRAEELGCSVVVYGHTHAAEIVEEGGILFINPGSCDYYTPIKTFAYLSLNSGKPQAFINEKTLNFI